MEEIIQKLSELMKDKEFDSKQDWCEDKTQAQFDANKIAMAIGLLQTIK